MSNDIIQNVYVWCDKLLMWLCSLSGFRTQSGSRWQAMHWQNASGFFVLNITHSFGKSRVKYFLSAYLYELKVSNSV